jgi:GNAT superfamily N-acetyltransferase
MEVYSDEFLISDNKTLIQPQRVFEMLQKSYWAGERSLETIKKSIEHSLCFGVYQAGEQVGFARCVTDYATIYWLADVIIDERFRGQGLGKALVAAVHAHESIKHLSGILATRDAHALYERHGFVVVDEKKYMRRPAVKASEEQEPTHK